MLDKDKVIDFNINWFVEVTLTDEGARIWNGSIYVKKNEFREAGDKVKEQLCVIMKLFGPNITSVLWLGIEPSIKLFVDDVVEEMKTCVP